MQSQSTQISESLETKTRNVHHALAGRHAILDLSECHKFSLGVLRGGSWEREVTPPDWVRWNRGVTDDDHHYGGPPRETVIFKASRRGLVPLPDTFYMERVAGRAILGAHGQDLVKDDTRHGNGRDWNLADHPIAHHSVATTIRGGDNPRLDGYDLRDQTKSRAFYGAYYRLEAYDDVGWAEVTVLPIQRTLRWRLLIIWPLGQEVHPKVRALFSTYNLEAVPDAQLPSEKLGVFYRSDRLYTVFRGLVEPY